MCRGIFTAVMHWTVARSWQATWSCLHAWKKPIPGYNARVNNAWSHTSADWFCTFEIYINTGCDLRGRLFFAPGTLDRSFSAESKNRYFFCRLWTRNLLFHETLKLSCNKYISSAPIAREDILARFLGVGHPQWCADASSRRSELETSRRAW